MAAAAASQVHIRTTLPPSGGSFEKINLICAN
jgi:hypothetical protein